MSTWVEGELPHKVVIDFEEIFFIDETGADTLTDFFAQRNDVAQSLARVHSDAHEPLKMAGIIDEFRVLNHWAVARLVER